MINVVNAKVVLYELVSASITKTILDIVVGSAWVLP